MAIEFADAGAVAGMDTVVVLSDVADVATFVEGCATVVVVEAVDEERGATVGVAVAVAVVAADLFCWSCNACCSLFRCQYDEICCGDESAIADKCNKFPCSFAVC